MVMKKKPKLPKKETKEVVNKAPKTKAVRRYVRIDKVEDRKKQGWTVVKEDLGKKHRTLGVKTSALSINGESQSDLVLMEK